MSIYIDGDIRPGVSGFRYIIMMADGTVTDIQGKPIGKAIQLHSHGRLVDADALMKKSYEIKSSVGRYSRVVHIMDVENAETIIPADPEGGAD